MGGPTSRGAGDEATAAWSAVGRLVAGPLLYGGLGWLVDRWLGTTPVFMAVGVIVGFAAAIYLVVATSAPASTASNSTASTRPDTDHRQEIDRGA